MGTIRQYLQARLVDEMHVAISPVLLGLGESLFAGINLSALGYERTEHLSSPHATHFVLARRGSPPKGLNAAAAALRRRRR